jgi:hypothetical protein
MDESYRPRSVVPETPPGHYSQPGAFRHDSVESCIEDTPYRGQRFYPSLPTTPTSPLLHNVPLPPAATGPNPPPLRQRVIPTTPPPRVPPPILTDHSESGLQPVRQLSAVGITAPPGPQPAGPPAIGITAQVRLPLAVSSTLHGVQSEVPKHTKPPKPSKSKARKERRKRLKLRARAKVVTPAGGNLRREVTGGGLVPGEGEDLALRDVLEGTGLRLTFQAGSTCSIQINR